MRLTSGQIEDLIDRLGETDASAVQAVEHCGDDDLIAHVRECEEGAGSDAPGPRASYPRILERLACERESATRTVREVRHDLFDLNDQDAPADVAMLIDSATGIDGTVERLAGLLVRVGGDHPDPAVRADARALAERFGWA